MHSNFFQKMSALQNFLNAEDKYYKTLDIVAGTGARGQEWINQYYNEMVEQHKLMNTADQMQYKLPQKAQSRNDGTGGIASGIGTVAADNPNCIIQ